MVNQKEKEKQNSKLYGAIGEIIMLAVVITAVFLIEFLIVKSIEIGIRLTFCMVSLLLFKQFYLNTFHAPRKPIYWKHNYWCNAITYGMFLIVILLTWSYKTEFSLIY